MAIDLKNESKYKKLNLIDRKEIAQTIFVIWICKTLYISKIQKIQKLVENEYAIVCRKLCVYTEIKSNESSIICK